MTRWSYQELMATPPEIAHKTVLAIARMRGADDDEETGGLP